jgi:hypothetical protein
VNLSQQDQALQAAQAAARRLLLRAIDLRFDLDDTADAAGSRGPLRATDLRRLRSDADALCHAIDRLAEAAWSPHAEALLDDDEIDEAAAAA